MQQQSIGQFFVPVNVAPMHQEPADIVSETKQPNADELNDVSMATVSSGSDVQNAANADDRETTPADGRQHRSVRLSVIDAQTLDRKNNNLTEMVAKALNVQQHDDQADKTSEPSMQAISVQEILKTTPFFETRLVAKDMLDGTHSTESFALYVTMKKLAILRTSVTKSLEFLRITFPFEQTGVTAKRSNPGNSLI